MGTNVHCPKSVQKEINHLCTQNHGELTPISVVKWASQHKQSALYRQFTWDDTEAARLYRLEQARRIIRLAITVIDQPQEVFKVPIRVRSYVSLSGERTENGDSTYREIGSVLSNKARRQMMLSDALSELRALHKKYLVLSELSPIWEAVEQIGNTMGRKIA